MSGLTHLEMSSFMAYRLKRIYRNADNHEHQRTRKNQNITRRDRRMRQCDAAKRLNISPRQVRRLIKQLEQDGPSSLAHKARGKPSNRGHSPEYRLTVLQTIREHYPDFPPTFAREKLLECHNLPVGLETLRNWMIADLIWKPRSQRKPKVYQPRHRRDCLGELIQIDGSHHDWFEGRRPNVACSFLSTMPLGAW